MDCIIDGLLLGSTDGTMRHQAAASVCIGTHAPSGRSTKIRGIIYSPRAIISLSLSETISPRAGRRVLLFHEGLDPRPIVPKSKKVAVCTLRETSPRFPHEIFMPAKNCACEREYKLHAGLNVIRRSKLISPLCVAPSTDLVNLAILCLAVRMCV